MEVVSDRIRLSKFALHARVCVKPEFLSLPTTNFFCHLPSDSEAVRIIITGGAGVPTTSPGGATEALSLFLIQELPCL